MQGGDPICSLCCRYPGGTCSSCVLFDGGVVLLLEVFFVCLLEAGDVLFRVLIQNPISIAGVYPEPPLLLLGLLMGLLVGLLLVGV